MLFIVTVAFMNEIYFCCTIIFSVEIRGRIFYFTLTKLYKIVFTKQNHQFK